MTTHLIISVGTSSLMNYNKTVPKDQQLRLHPPQAWEHQELSTNTNFPPPEMFCANYDGLKTALSNPTIRQGIQGAEESTVTKVLAEFRNHASADEASPHYCYHLIATTTVEGMFCASVLGHEIFKPTRQVKYYLPTGLGATDDPDFADTGVWNLLSCLTRILNNIDQQGETAIIIPTGGYKALIPYLIIAAILYKKPAYYTYERTEVLLDLPALPLSIDSTEFRSIAILLENLIGFNQQKAADVAAYYNAIPTYFQKLVYTGKNGKFHYTAFGQRLKDMFSEAAKSPLQIRTSKNTLLEKLGDYRPPFLELTKLGETVWLGDKAPEMADHARHHHLNLFAYAELLLLPIFADKKTENFLSSAELFLLLGMIYLHDCGHALATFHTAHGEDVPLLPTEIRNYHNLLGLQRLHDQAFYDALTRQGVQYDPTLLHNIATLAVYHRQKMKLLTGASPCPDGTTLPPIVAQTLEGLAIPGKRLALLAALFRMIDGMDKQVARAGDAMEIAMRAETILADLPRLWQRVERMKAAIANVPPPARQIADNLLRQIIVEYGFKEAAAGIELPPQTPSQPERLCYLELRERLQALFKNDLLLSQTLPLLWEYLDARVRFFFQALQPSYYYSDLLLAMPRVTHRTHQSGRMITITYSDAADPTGKDRVLNIWEQIRAWVKENVSPHDPEYYLTTSPKTTPESVVNQVRKEYRKLDEQNPEKNNTEVADILAEYQLRLEVRYARI